MEILANENWGIVVTSSSSVLPFRVVESMVIYLFSARLKVWQDKSKFTVRSFERGIQFRYPRLNSIGFPEQGRAPVRILIRIFLYAVIQDFR